ncbi:DUF6264 family protein [Mycetocola spongiae]|uniref:DUF6264 family protein n=1 Tax=Mycetocola spongiae TaxID=2859226 RepID=UPI001CF4EB63|nr:DUF6264 family protein [Mycetocola spongiae]UCR89003.1 DUF4064 domain-containing protein [Mycetocola spongiae]
MTRPEPRFGEYAPASADRPTPDTSEAETPTPAEPAEPARGLDVFNELTDSAAESTAPGAPEPGPAAPAEGSPASAEAPAPAKTPAARPARPEYGEYATPEEQAARMGGAGGAHAPTAVTPAAQRPNAGLYGAGPAADDTTSRPASAPGEVPIRPAGSLANRPLGKTPAGGEVPIRPAGSLANRPVGNRPASADAPVQPPRDRIISFILLGFGLFMIFNTLPLYLSLGTEIERTLRAFNVEGYDSVGTANIFGWIALALTIAAWAGAAILTIRRVNRGKLSWWIPLIAGVIGFVLILIVMAAAMQIDPSFQDFKPSLEDVFTTFG